MSTFRTSCLVLALSAALPVVAHAADLQLRPAHLAIHAQEAVRDEGSKASNAHSVAYWSNAGNPVIGRTSAIKVEIELDGAYFNNYPVVSPLQASMSAWTIGNMAGNDYRISFVMSPNGEQTIHAGYLFGFWPGDLKLYGLPVDGGTVTADIRITDAVTGALLKSSRHDVITVAEGTYVTATAVQPAKIDVKTGKVGFVGGSNTVQLGIVTTGYVDGDESRAGLQKVGIEGSGVVANGDALATVTDQIVFGPADKLMLTVTAEDAAAFTPIPGGANQSNVGIHVAASNVACTSASPKLTQSASDPSRFTGTSAIVPAGSAFRICAVANGVTEIASKGFQVEGKVDFADARMVDKPIPRTALATLSYNAPVVRVDHFNPASNADQQSYLRVTNTSNVAGDIVIDGVCDNGIASTTPLRVRLDQQKSILLTSGDIENGNPGKGVTNGLGACPTGKSRLTVTGEVGSMTVQNFLRNTTSGGLINTNVNNQD